MSPDHRALLARSLGLAALAVALCAPVLRAPLRQVLGSPHTDTVKHVWTLWAGRELLFDGTGLWGDTALINAPVGMDFFVIEPVGALFSALLAPFPVVLVANLLSFANLLLLGLAAAWMGDELAGGRAPGFVAGVVAMGSAVTVHALHIGVGELQHLFLLPAALALLVRVARTGSWRDTVLLGLTVGVTGIAGLYLGLFVGCLVGVAGLGLLVTGPHRLRSISRLLPAAALSLLVVAPLVRGLQDHGPTRQEGPQVTLAQYRPPPAEIPEHRADLRRVLLPTELPLESKEPAYLGGDYVGVLLIGLAVVGVVRRPRLGLPLAAAGLSGLTIAAGSHPVWGGAELSVPFQDSLGMPFGTLRWVLGAHAAPPHYPSRFMAVFVIACAGLGALALTGLRGHRGTAAAAGLVVLLGVDIGLHARPGWPLSVAATPDTTGFDQLAERERGAVIDLSYYSERDFQGRNASAWYQVAHGLPTQIVPIARIDYLNRDGAAQVLANGFVDAMVTMRRSRRAGLPDGDWSADLALLREDGFSWVLAYGTPPADAPHPRDEDRVVPREIARALTDVLGPPVIEVEYAAVWHIPALDVDPDALDRVRAARDGRVEEARALVFARP